MSYTHARTGENMTEKSIVITGASAGIGAALAKQLAARSEQLGSQDLIPKSRIS